MSKDASVKNYQKTKKASKIYSWKVSKSFKRRKKQKNLPEGENQKLDLNRTQKNTNASSIKTQKHI